MKAAQINKYGDNSVIEINNVEKPSISAGQVLVEVYASSLNPVDSIIRAGYMQQMVPLQFPTTLGGDIAGVIVEVADDVTDFAVGDKVYGQSLNIGGNSGALAEYANANVGKIAKIPAGIDFQQAASLPLVAASALQALVQNINLKSGQKLFINGGSGGIGTIAIQVAKALGAHVATTATGDGIELVKNLGADEVIDYKTEDFSTKLKDFDAVLNNVRGDDFNKSLTILKPGSIAVSLAGDADAALAEKLQIKTISQYTQVTSDVLNTLNKLIEDGKVKPQIDKVYPLDSVKEAFDSREGGSIRGKIVIAIK